MSEIKISVAGPQDAEELLEIYAPYVRDTAVSFEYTVPSPEEFRQRIIHTLEKYPGMPMRARFIQELLMPGLWKLLFM